MVRAAPLLTLALVACAHAAQAPPALLGHDAAALADVRARLEAGDEALRPALDRLVAEADAALEAEYATVLDKEALPPSGDAHDFYSLAPYWWPNPATDDGLPYVRRDGRVNPESRSLDDRSLAAVLEAVPTLAWAWHFTGDDRYAEKAGDLLRKWFVAPATRMNPHLRYAQGVRGRSTGRMYGIIETARLAGLVDPLIVLRSAPALTEAEWAGLDGWLGDYLAWLRTSEFGRGEASRPNNHATAYDAQAAALALYLGQDATAREILSAFPARRIDAQVAPDGRQPEELARTRSFGYSVFNLRWAFHAARLAPAVGADLFGYESADGRSLRAALDYLVPVADGRAHWPHPQLEGTWRGAEAALAGLLRQAAVAYDAPAYEAARRRLAPDDDGRHLLLFPVR
jgi:hypothetical protein